MALTETETYGTVIPGFVTDLDGNLAVTSDDSQVQWREGFLRDLDGRLVVAEDTGIMQDGFLRTPGGALCVTTGPVTQRGTKIPGFPTDDDGLICVANDGSPARGLYPGFMFDGGKLCVTGFGGGSTTLYSESFTTDDGGWLAQDSTVERYTFSSHTAPASLIVIPTDFASDPVAIGPIFNATAIDGVELWAARGGSYPADVEVVMYELDADNVVVDEHVMGTLTNSDSTSFAKKTYTPPTFTGGVKAALVLRTTTGYWDGAGPLIDDIQITGTP